MKQVFLLLSLFCASVAARADLTQIEVDNAYFSGAVFAFPMPNPATVTSGEGGGAMNMIPVSYAFTRKSNAQITAGFSTDIAIEQIKIYVPATNQFIPITPRTITSYAKTVSKLGGSDNGTNADESVAGAIFFRTFNTAPYNNDEYRFGKFRFRVKINVNQTTFVDIFSMEFIVSPIGLRDANSNGGTDPFGSGGGITGDDLNDQPVNQEGFWQGIFSALFIPNEETLNTFRDTLAQWGTWGPFGIINYVNSRINAYSQEQQLDYAFNLDLPFAGTTTFDLSPYETFIKIARVLMAMTIWIYVVMGLWKKVYQKV